MAKDLFQAPSERHELAQLSACKAEMSLPMNLEDKIDNVDDKVLD
jgi:hypothetical protein